jgi:hypothetical protein
MIPSDPKLSLGIRGHHKSVLMLLSSRNCSPTLPRPRNIHNLRGHPTIMEGWVTSVPLTLHMGHKLSEETPALKTQETESKNL